MKFKNIRAVGSDLKDRFGIEMQLHQVIRNSAEALKKLGVFAVTKTFVVDTIVDFCITLQNVYDVRAVIRLEPPPLGTKIKLDDIYFPPQIIFTLPEADEEETEQSVFEDNYIGQIKGPYIDFVWDCPILKFNEDKMQVGIYATGLKLDEEGYPMVPEEAVEACSFYCAYIYNLPLFMMGKLAPVIWGEIKQLKETAFGQARWKMTMTDLNQNEMDKLFDIMSSYERKAINLPI